MGFNIQTLSFNASEFSTAISFAKLMTSKGSSKNQRSIILHVEDNKLVCRSHDDTGSCSIEYYVSLCEDENNISNYIAASINDLSALTKYSNDDKLTIKKCLNQYEISVIGGGWLPFNVSDFSYSKTNDECDKVSIGEINSVYLKNVISCMLNYTQEYTYSRDKYIKFTDSECMATSRKSGVIISGKFINITLHRDVAALLKFLLKENENIKVVKYTPDDGIERTEFIGEKFKFTTISSDVQDVKINVKNSDEYVVVNCSELLKLATFSEEYSASKHLLGFSIKNKKLNVSVKNNITARHTSVLNSTVVGNTDSCKEIEVPSHGLIKALKVFQDKHVENINIYINEGSLCKNDEMVIFEGNTKTIINIYNR